MSTRLTRRGFTLVELLVVIAIIGILVALLLPAINAARQAALRNSCQNNIRQIGLALHTYADAMKKFPVVGNGVGANNDVTAYTRGSTNITTNDYSWIVRLLPYLEEGNIYNQLSTGSSRFTLQPYAANVVGAGNFRVAQLEIPTLKCPSFSGDVFCDISQGSWPGISVTTNPITQGSAPGPAITTYVALLATHKEYAGGLPTTSPNRPNGAITAGKSRATSFGSIKDGTSKTVVISESKEQGNAAWIESCGTWTVGLTPATTSTTNPALTGGVWNASGTVTAGINVGITGPTLTAYGTVGSLTRNWGPSSDHGGDIVLHCFLDNGVRPITAEITPNAYFALITRAGGAQDPQIPSGILD
ncbi:MAG: DUF1559 domain-containing protein [Planctomycetota bacterium]|nr:DUF1559 domain-containing protein [Planctomycetota bacterium]